jgi:hypothetical protein
MPADTLHSIRNLGRFTEVLFTLHKASPIRDDRRMIDLKTGLNAFGIFLSALGVWIVYVNSPLNFSSIDGGDASTDSDAIEKSTIKRNHYMRVGVWFVISGSLLQLISNFIPVRR